MAAVLAVAFIVLLFVGVPRLIAVYELYWSRGNIQRLFYEDLGLSEAWSSFIGVVGSFVYALAWVPLALWTYRLLAWRFSPRQLAIAFASWVFVYGHVPLMHALMGSDACFNQRTGAPMKWFVEGSTGEIALFDSGGFDTTRGVEKRPVTSEICASFARQKTSARPHRITANVREIEFFDPNSGRARVWYSKASDGSFDLFDASGFHPATSEALLPVTREVVAEIMARATKDEEQARKRAEAAEAQRLIEAEEARKRAEADAKRQAVAEAARLGSEQAEARRRALGLTTPECPGKVEKITLTAQWFPISNGGKCKFLSDISVGDFNRIEAKDEDGKVFPWSTLNRSTTRWIRATKGDLPIKMVECPDDHSSKLADWNCTLIVK